MLFSGTDTGEEKREFTLDNEGVCLPSPGSALFCAVLYSAPSVPQLVFTITEKAPTRAFSWLKAPTSAFTFKTYIRHYANQPARPL